MTDPEQNPTRHFLLQEAITLLQTQRNEEAIPVLAQYLRINPNSEQAWFMMSYAIKERSKKIYCLEKVLAINPQNTQARERLEKFKNSQSDQPAQQKSKRKQLPWLVGIIGTSVIIILAVAGIGGIASRLRSNPLPTATFQSMAQITEAPLPSQTPLPTTASTNTPTYPTATPSPSQTAQPSPTPLVINDFVYAEMDQIQIQVSELRQLAEKHSVQRNFIHQNNVKPLLESIYLEKYSRDEVASQARVLSALGLIDPKYDLFGKTIDQLGEGIGGFYIPWKDELYIIGTELSGTEKFVFAHEYSHALVDQYYYLDSIGVYPECLTDADRCSAISALLEGDATYLMYQWLEKYGTETNIAEILADQYAPLEKTISSSDLAPPYVLREIQFRYGDGLKFVDHLYQIGRWQMVNKAYERLPETSEQILHPEKYQTRETAVPLEMPDLQGILGNDWLFLGSGTLGELGTEMILGYSANGLSQIAPEEASSAAAGWGGDTYQVFYKSTTNKHVLAVHWIWDRSFAYDPTAEADEFWEAMWQFMNLRYRGDIVETELGDCWQLLNDHYSCIFKNGLEVLWISSPDLNQLATIRDQYPGFYPPE